MSAVLPTFANVPRGHSHTPDGRPDGPEPLLAKSAQVVQHGRWPADPRFYNPVKSSEIQVRWCQLWVSVGQRWSAFGMVAARSCCTPAILTFKRQHSSLFVPKPSRGAYCRWRGVPAWEPRSVNVRWRPLLTMAIVTRLVTRSLTSLQSRVISSSLFPRQATSPRGPQVERASTNCQLGNPRGSFPRAA
jgi:hypothetical protein